MISYNNFVTVRIIANFSRRVFVFSLFLAGVTVFGEWEDEEENCAIVRSPVRKEGS